MPSVVIVGPAHPLRGGIATFNERLAREFQNSGWTTTIYTFSLQYPAVLFPGKSQYTSKSKPDDLDIRICINSINPVNWILNGRVLQKMKPDLLIVRYWIPFMAPCLGTILRLVKKNMHTKIICLADNIIPHEKRLGDELLTRYFLKSPDAYIVMGEPVKRDLLQLKPRAVSALVEHPLFDNFGERQDKLEARKYLNIPIDVKLILFFGFIRRYKGLDLLLQALALPIVKESNVQLLVAGEFYEDEKPYLKIIEENNLENRIHLHNHFIPDHEVKYFFSAADVIVQPYRDATQSGVTPLGYYFEQPMIVTDVGALAGQVPDGLAGMVCKPNPDSLAATIHRFFKTDPTQYSIGLRQMKLKLSWRTFVDKTLDLYNLLRT